jgi:hypothetical protein
MMTTQTYRWAVECDGERREFRTREEAREWCRYLRRHPSNVNIRRHGPYRNATGAPRIVDSWGE